MVRCVKCGKPNEPKPLCKECYLKSNPIILGFRDIVVKMCIHCNKTQVQNKWAANADLEAAITRSVQLNVRFSKDYTRPIVHVEPIFPQHEPKSGMRLEGEAVLTVEASQGDVRYEEEYRVPVTILYMVCPACSTRGTTYYVAVLQVRNADADVQKHVESLIQTAIRGDVQITQTVRLADGIDFYLTDHNFARRFGMQLQKDLGGELKVSAKLFSKSSLTSKDLYRTTVLLKLHDIRVGDVLRSAQKVVLVRHVGKEMTGLDLESGHKVIFDHMKESPTVLEKRTTTISRLIPRQEALHPLTYESIKIENPLPAKMGEKVVVAIDGERLFRIPKAKSQKA